MFQVAIFYNQPSNTMNPPMNKSITTLKRDLFKTTQKLMALVVPGHACKSAMTTLKGHGLLTVAKLPTIIPGPSSDTRMLLLSPEIEATTVEALPDAIKSFAKLHSAELKSHTIELEYNHWSVDQILRSILPDDIDVPCSFETVGHIAHVNLREEHGPYKHIIAQVILDKSAHIRSVVNKTGNIENTFRFFEMEVLAGDNNMIAEMKEDKCSFKFDFSKVYWNSRLQGEHHRLISMFKPNELICDVFAGVGPFAVPAARNGKCMVFANDLNPVSYKYLNENIVTNKVIQTNTRSAIQSKPLTWTAASLLRNHSSLLTIPKYGKGFMSARRRRSRRLIDASQVISPSLNRLMFHSDTSNTI
jgi:tRNA (guanine37-N1)-methyltransferase